MESEHEIDDKIKESDDCDSTFSELSANNESTLEEKRFINNSVSDHNVLVANASNNNEEWEENKNSINFPHSRKLVKSLSDLELNSYSRSDAFSKVYQLFKKSNKKLQYDKKTNDERCSLFDKCSKTNFKQNTSVKKNITETLESPRNMLDSDEMFIPAYCIGYTSTESDKKVNEKPEKKSTASLEESQKSLDPKQGTSSTGPCTTELKPVKSFVDFDRNWQCTKSSIKERMSFMFNNELMADVHFIMTIGRETNQKNITIPAHKFVLSISSSVFDAMFNGQLSHPSDENAIIEITDIEPAAFLNLLRFFYTDQVTLCPETVMATLYAAKKYAASLLEFACVDYLKSNLSGENACMLLAQARLFDEPQLATMCLEVIDHSTLEAVSADSFTEIDLETLCIILQRDSLEIRESSLYSSIIRWAQAECSRNNLPATAENQRNVLDKALNYIRFPLMSIEEFASGPAQSNLLSDREVVQIFLYFTAKPRPSIRFSDAVRCCTASKEECVCRFSKVEKRWGYSGHTDRIRFMVNRKIFIVGFGLYGSIHASAKYFANIQLMHSDFRSVCGENDVVYSSNGTTETVKVMFKEPIEISANVSYTACATIQGPDSYYGAKGVRKVVSGKTTFQFFYNAGNNNGTSVEDGQLPEIYFYT